MKTIVFADTADRALQKLPREVQERIDAALDRYAINGDGDVKKLQGFDALRSASATTGSCFRRTQTGS